MCACSEMSCYSRVAYRQIREEEIEVERVVEEVVGNSGRT
jgi:hypothetical protein